MINLSLNNINFSYSLPDKFTIGQADESVVCKIYIDSVMIYSVTLYSVNSVATFYELRSLVEEHMRGRYLTIAKLKIVVDMNTGQDVMNDKYVVYSAIRHTVSNDAAYLSSHFLTSRERFMVPRGKEFTVSMFTPSTSVLTVSVMGTFLLNGVLNQTTYNLSVGIGQNPYIFQITLDSATVTAKCEEEDGDTCGRLMSVTVSCGDRSLTAYYTDDKTMASFRFRNSFNVQEYLHVIGKDSLKTDINRKEATCLGVTSFYDESVEKKHHVETCHLSIDEANWMNEFLTSKQVVCCLPSVNQDVAVLLSDITSEIVYGPNEEIRIKFAWRTADNADWRIVEQVQQVFNQVFNYVFR